MIIDITIGKLNINNLCGAMFAVCLMATTCFPDVTTLKLEIAKGLYIFQEVFEVNLSNKTDQINFRALFDVNHIKLIFFELIIPLLQHTGLALGGTCCFCSFGNIFGRRNALLATASLTIGLYVAKIIHDHKAMSILTSFTTMGSLITVLTYVGEISPINIRGILITLPSAMTVPKYFYDLYLEPYTYKISLTLLSLAFLLTYIFCEETPYFHLIQEHPGSAFKALSAYRRGEVSIDDEIQQMQDDIKEQKRMKLKELLYTSKIGIRLLFFQWFAIANAAIILGSWLYKSMYGKEDEFPQFIVYAILLSPLLSPLLIDMFNRKKLLAVSTLGMTFVHAMWCIGYQLDLLRKNSFKLIAPILFCIFDICYNIGIGTLVWVYFSEIYPTLIKIWLLGISLFLTYYCSFIILIPFLFCYVIFLNYVPVVGMMLLLISLVIASYFMLYRDTIIETKGKSLREIQEELRKDF